MNARRVQDKLRDLLEAALLDRDEDARGYAEYVEGIRRVSTYAEVGMLTRDKGLVIGYDDGSEYQLTIVESIPPGEGEEDGDARI